MGQRVKNTSKKYATDIKFNRYIDYSIFLKKDDIIRASSYAVPSFATNLALYIESVLINTNGATAVANCGCTNGSTDMESINLFLPENILTNTRTTNSKVRRGMEASIDIIEAVKTVVQDKKGCDDPTPLNTKDRIISYRKLKELYIPLNAQVPAPRPERDRNGKYKRGVERPNNAINLKESILKAATKLGACTINP